MEDTPHIRGRGLICHCHTPTVLPDVPIPVRRFADEPALLDSPSQALADIERLLLGVEARHVGERPAHHAARGIALGRLRHRDEGESVLALQTFELYVVEQVAGSPIDLVEEQPIELLSVFLRVGDQFLEGLSLVGLARCLSDAKQASDFTADICGVSTKSVFLNGEGESLSLLLATAYPCQGDEAFHSAHSRAKTPNNCPAFRTIVTASWVERGLA